ncbi:MAG: T9SS type A sorting domain-containing protein, partial [Bacteroidota bacterium]
TSLEGKPVFRSEASGENVVFDTSGLPAGIYFYRYLSKEGKIVSSGRFIVQ